MATQEQVYKSVRVRSVDDSPNGLPDLRYTRRKITAAEMATIFATPVTIWPGTPNATTWVERCVLRKPAGAVVLGGLTNVLGTYTGSGFNWAALVAASLGDAGVVTNYWSIGTSSDPIALHLMRGTDLIFKGSGANPTSFPTGLELKVWFRVFR